MVVRAPGRANLIGEHTDYNDGLVMPAAIGFYTYAAVASREDDCIRVHSANYDESAEFSLDESAGPRSAPVAGSRWSSYVRGVALSLRRHGVPIRGADVLVHGDVPIGAGLSSSASIEVACAMAFTHGMSPEPNRMALANICQEAENEYVGTRCGIMDPFAALFGQRQHALYLDCRSLDWHPVPLQTIAGSSTVAEPVRLVVANTGVRHALADGEYNRRRSECERAVSALANSAPGIGSLRDLTSETLAALRVSLEPTLARRCAHVVSENERVTAASNALMSGDMRRLGALMAESHQSLREDFEVSCDELDIMVALALELDGVFGSRMMGGGFGGCTISLVGATRVERFSALLAERYARATGRKPDIFVCDAVDGAEFLG